MDESPPDATRVFLLLRTLAKGEKQSAEDTHELIELIRNMASENTISQIKAELNALNVKFQILIWAITFAGLVLGGAIIFSG